MFMPGFDFYDVKKEYYYYFSKRKGKCSYKIAQIYYYEPQSVRINMQSPQNESTAKAKIF